MIAAILILLPLCVVSFYQFLKRSPRTIKKKALRLFNIATVLTAIAWTVADSWLLHGKMGVDIGWFWVVASLRGATIFLVVLLTMGLVRNLCVFRK
ncbi:MAG: hypothetical protein A2Z20_02695 [Bdellovibrionales bacterium RBG_16_40_8]|nr:MAG: hypothetical protein A2Z20_02695 [Bdellovibrionales bacterium RBG_16_40_8]